MHLLTKSFLTQVSAIPINDNETVSPMSFGAATGVIHQLHS